MRRAQLEHVLRAAGVVADVDDLVVVGSAALLASKPEPSGTLARSIEVHGALDEGVVRRGELERRVDLLPLDDARREHIRRLLA